MNDKLIISRTILQDIANAIREKTGDSGLIKVKNMPTTIQNISTGGKIPITLTGGLKAVVEQCSLVLYGHIGAEVIESGFYGHSTLTGNVEHAQVWSYGRYGGGAWEMIGVDYSTENGEFDWAINAYGPEYIDFDEYKITYEGYGTFEKAEDLVITTPTLTATVNADKSANITLYLVNSEGLMTLVNDNVVTNNNGELSVDVEEGVDTKVVYKGQFTSLNTRRPENFNYVTSLHLPKTVTSLDEFYFQENNTIKSLLLQDSRITVAPVLDSNSNLKVFRLPDTITEFGGNISNCHLDYYNIPGKNNPNITRVNLLYNSTTKCLDIGSGFNQLLDDSKFGIDSFTHIEDVHFIFPGKPIGIEVPNLSFNAPLRRGTYINARVDFQADTERILAGSAAELGNVNRINIPVGCTYIEEGAFENLRLSSPGLLRFESCVPPQFGEYDNPLDCFPAYSAEKYHVLCPIDYRDMYVDAFRGYDDFYVVEEGNVQYPLCNEKGEFSIEIIGDSLKSNPDYLPFADLGSDANEVKYYLDDIVQEDYFNFNEALDFSFDYYGRHTLTVAGGFSNVNGEVFIGNKDIVKVRFPKKLERVDYSAFAGCTNLRTLIFPSLDGAPSVDDEEESMSFTGLHPDCKVYVPDIFEDVYRDVAGLKQYTIIPFKTSE